MENTGFISDYKPAIKGVITQLKLPENQVISFSRFENESSYHDWTTSLFKDRNIQKLIIPIALPSDTLNAEGLKMALHIRLNYELSLKQRLIPIVFLSDFKMDTLLKKATFDTDNNPQYLLFTKGAALSSFDSTEINTKTDEINSCHEDEYHTDILNKLKILSKANVGKHSIANAWGCFKLALISGNKDILFNKKIANDLKTLYAKYLICLNDTFSESNFCDLDPLSAIDKKILFIDDQADEGWGDLMKRIFSKNHLTVVDSAKYKNQETKQFHDFDGFYEESKTHIKKDWDLIIIDLRLHPEKEDIDNDMISPTELKGYKLIDNFLSANDGYQIIVFTASNKIWNIDTALNRGAYSYYIKESPEFNYSIRESRKQYGLFKEDVNNCFKRKYLFDIYEIHKKCKLFIDTDRSAKNEKYKLFYNRASSQLDIAFELLKRSAEPKFINFAYLSYYQILEDYAKLPENFEYDDILGYYVNQYLVIDTINKEWKLICKEKTLKGFTYFEKGVENNKEGKPTALAKISFILAYKFAKDNSFLMEWGRLNNLRNTVAAHGGNVTTTIFVDDVKSLLNMVELFLTNP